MDTIICGSTAYHYWRMPPVVQLLVAGPEDDCLVRGLLGADELIALRMELAATLPLSVACAPGPSWRNAGEDARRIREIHHLLAPAVGLPVEILVEDAKRCHRSKLVTPRLWSACLPFGSLSQISTDVCITSPAFTVLQLASRFGVVRTALLASELCGSFAVFKSPAPLARALQGLIDRGRLPELDGWRPSLKDGRLTDLWMRPPLLEPSDLCQVAATSESRNGRATLESALGLVVPGAASPFEVQAGALLGFPKSLGGEGLAGLRFNERVPLTSEARLLCGKECCYCDIYWEDGVDVECQSAQHHDNLDSYVSDSERTAALKAMGIEVVPLTYGQLSSPDRFDAVVRLIAEIRGISLRKKTPRQLMKSAELRNELLWNWQDLPN